MSDTMTDDEIADLNAQAAQRELHACIGTATHQINGAVGRVRELASLHADYEGIDAEDMLAHLADAARSLRAVQAIHEVICANDEEARRHLARAAELDGGSDTTED